MHGKDAVARLHGLAVVRATILPYVEVVSSLKLLISAGTRLGWEKAILRGVIHNALTISRMGVPKDEQALLRKALADLE